MNDISKKKAKTPMDLAKAREKSSGRKLLLVFLFNALLLGGIMVIWGGYLQRYYEFKPVLKGEFKELVTLNPAQKLENFKYMREGSNVIQNETDFEAKWYVVNFWATWCAPCIKELPSLQKLQDMRGSKNFEVKAISIDSNTSMDEIREFLKRNDIAAAVALYRDYHGTIFKNHSMPAVPTTWIIDPMGRVVASYVGEADWASEDALDFVDSFVKK
jgi:thiol-disulfide isomerase/thioredoxin